MGKETAEQKLLKLIEKTDSQGDPSQPQEGSGTEEAQKVYDSVRGVGVATEALPNILTNILSLFQGALSKDPSASAFGLRQVNILLAVAILIAALSFGISFSQGMGSIEKNNQEFQDEISKSLQNSIENLNSFLPTFKSLPEYIQVIARRNIFQPFERNIVVNKEEVLEEELGIKRVSSQTKDLKLVGISWFDSPDTASAMVENKISGVTYFLGQGERINDVMIKSIYADSIVVSYQGEEIEMKL